MIKKHSNTNLLSKAFYSSVVGLPLSYVLNVVILPPFAPMFLDNPFIASGLIAIPFMIASVFRMFVIDWTYERYRIDISPKTVFTKLYYKVKGNDK